MQHAIEAPSQTGQSLVNMFCELPDCEASLVILQALREQYTKMNNIAIKLHPFNRMSEQQMPVGAHIGPKIL